MQHGKIDGKKFIINTYFLMLDRCKTPKDFADLEKRCPDEKWFKKYALPKWTRACKKFEKELGTFRGQLYLENNCPEEFRMKLLRKGRKTR